MKQLFILICALLAVTSPLLADNNKEEVDTVKVPFFNGIAIHADIAGPITHIIDSGDGHYEVGTRINLKDKFFPAVEAAMSINYNPFFRIGIDYNLLKNKHDKYKLFIGARYGFGKFDYSQPNTTPDKVRHWVEISLGTDMKMVGPFHMGFDVRWRKGGFFLLYYLNFVI